MSPWLLEFVFLILLFLKKIYEAEVTFWAA